MLKKVVLVVLGFVALLAVFVATRPAEFAVERTQTIEVPAQTAFEYLRDFHNFGAWSPWAKLDNQMKQTFEGAERGLGAQYAWAGNNQVGEGRMTIVDEKPGERIDIKLEFLKPWPSTSQATYLLAAKGAESVEVTWRMTGHNDFMGKLMSVVMDMDKMVGGDFERGLAALSDQLKKQAATAATAATTAVAEGTTGATGAGTEGAIQPADTPEDEATKSGSAKLEGTTPEASQQ
ncbi:MAG: SRPBCC family protein [Deltaproteobacteria bacterium]|nr:SRPBCC family protein [Deltaproteobacteria bacterium]